MKLKAKIFAAAACAVALCVALVGCAGGASDDASNFQGDWVLKSGVVDGQEVTEEMLDQASQLGLSAYMQLNEDGSVVLNLLGQEMAGTWKAKDATTVELEFEGNTEEAKLEGDDLVMSDGTNNIHFKRGNIPAVASEAEPDQEQAAEPEA